MNELRALTVSAARPLPVIVMADISGSMAGDGKIDALNAAVAEMIAAFAEEDGGLAEIQVAIVTFGGEAKLHIPLSPAAAIDWRPLAAGGRTPLGAALEIATRMLEDRTRLPTRAYRPAIVLVSDGIPTDDWRAPLTRLLALERASKGQRFALAIGADADREVLQAFVGDAGGVFEAHQAREIRRFFRWVTMTVATRSQSATPDRALGGGCTAGPGPHLAPRGILDLDDYGDF